MSEKKEQSQNNPENSNQEISPLATEEARLLTKQTNRTMLYVFSFIMIGLIATALIYKVPGLTTTGNVIGNMENIQVKLTTNHGEIIIELYGDMPITTNNFINLVKKGTYNGVIFHRIIDNFMIQGGDPTGTGMGDPNIPNIQDEFTHTGGNNNKRGTISMANAGPNTGSSQFFINLVDNNNLDLLHPAFGEIIQGMDIVDKIAKVQVDSGNKPTEDVIIKKAEVL